LNSSDARCVDVTVARIAIAVVLVIAACGGAPAAAPPTNAPTAVTIPSPTPTPLLSGAIRFAAAPKSQVTVRVQEHLAVNTINTDAVLTTDGVTGTITLLPDGTFTPDSKITVDMTKLKSDQDLRDTWIRLFGIETNKFKDASFVPRKAAGLPSPLPATGTWPFSIDGDLTIHGVTKPATWSGTATRTGPDLNATAKLSTTWADWNVGKPQAAVTQVVSVSDEIRLEMTFVGTQKD